MSFEQVSKEVPLGSREEISDMMISEAVRGHVSQQAVLALAAVVLEV